MEFQYYLPVNLIFGQGKADLVGEETAKYGRRALVVTGRNSARKTGLLDRIQDSLKKAGVSSVVYDQARPNPLASDAYRGMALAREEKCDVVVAAGGGSIIDCGKAIAFLAKNDGDIFDYIFGLRNGSQALPLVALPTTCGTGSEGNCFAVLTNDETGDKKSLRNMVSLPKVSIIDPELMVTMPNGVASSVMFDALCHNMEAYLSKTTQPLVMQQALFGVELLSDNIRRALADHSDMEAWARVCLGSTLGGMCINMAGVALPHGMEHPASGLRDIVHGRGLAALAPVIYEATVPRAPEKFQVLAQHMGGGDFLVLLTDLLRDIGLETTLSAEGVRKEDVEWMADNCLKVSAAAISAHPVQFDREAIAELYRRAM